MFFLYDWILVLMKKGKANSAIEEDSAGCESDQNVRKEGYDILNYVGKSMINQQILF